MDKFWVGMLLALAMAALGPALVGLVSAAVSSAEAAMYIVIFVLIGLAVSQLLWILPLLAYAHWSKRPELKKGLLAGAGVVALLNAACFGFLRLRPW